MKNVIKRLLFCGVVSLLFAFSSTTKVYAVEGIDNLEEVAISKEEADANSTNPGQVYLNQPLDNPVPVIYQYEILEDGYITPGEEFTLKFTIYNPAVVSNVGNISVIVSETNDLIYPVYGHTNSIYLGSLGTLQYMTGEIKLMASQDIKEDELKIDLQMTYTDSYSTLTGLHYSAVLPVNNKGKLNVGTFDVSSQMHVGANNRISVSYSNNGLSTINDITLHISGDSIEDQSASLGSLGSNSSSTSDVYLDFTEAKEQNITMFFTYTDREGNTHETDRYTYTLNVQNIDIEGTTQNNYDAARYRNNYMLTAFALIVCLGILFVFFSNIFTKNRKNKKL